MEEMNNMGNVIVTRCQDDLIFRITITSPSGKELILDYSGDKIAVFGDLPYDEAAKNFFSALSSYFEQRLKQERDKYESRTN